MGDARAGSISVPLDAAKYAMLCVEATRRHVDVLACGRDTGNHGSTSFAPANNRHQRPGAYAGSAGCHGWPVSPLALNR